MICKNCSAEYDDSLAQCPECGMENEAETARFDAQSCEDAAKEESADETEGGQDEVSEEVTSEEVEGEEQNDTLKEESAEDAKASDEVNETSEENPFENEADFSENKQEEAEKAEDKLKAEAEPVKKHPALRANVRRRRVPVVTKEEKRVSTGLIVMLCIIGVLAAGVSFVNITTDVFRIDNSAQKVVAGVGFTVQEKKQVEELLSKCFSVAKKSFDNENVTAEEFLSKLNPGDKGNVYSTVNGGTEKLQTEADPAERFADENGEYAYYKVAEKKIDRVLSVFGLESRRGENCENYYYCDGYYYFVYEKASTAIVLAEVTKSKRVLDGGYYAQCRFYKEGKEETKSKACYLLIDAQKDEDSGETVFTVRKISLKPIFGSDGKLVSTEAGFERKTEVIEGITKDGTLFSKYVIDYPLVEGDEAGYGIVSDFFKNAVSVYELKAESAEDEYKAFKAAGGNKKQLPYTENVTVKIVTDDKDNISFKVIVSKLDPLSAKPDSEADDEQQSEAVRLYEKSVEAYTIDKKSGNFVSKDSVVGKDYMLVSELLYRIYNGYEYDSLLSEEEQDYYYGYDEIPDDIYGVGTAIYESAWALDGEGVTFYYVNEKGYVSEVTIPEKVLKKLV